MILVDVEIPCLQKTRDFFAEEEVPIEKVVAEIVEILRREEKEPPFEQPPTFSLWHRKSRRRLAGEYSLSDYGITSGETLLLI